MAVSHRHPFPSSIPPQEEDEATDDDDDDDGDSDSLAPPHWPPVTAALAPQLPAGVRDRLLSAAAASGEGEVADGSLLVQAMEALLGLVVGPTMPGRARGIHRILSLAVRACVRRERAKLDWGTNSLCTFASPPHRRLTTRSASRW